MRYKKLLVALAVSVLVIISCTFVVGAAYASEPDNSSGYTLQITNKQGESIELHADEIDLSVEFHNILDTLSSDSIKLNIYRVINDLGINHDISVSFNRDKVYKILTDAGWIGSNRVLPTDAYIDFSDELNTFVIVPENEGDTLNVDLTLDIIEINIAKLNTSLNLSETTAYLKPDVTSSILQSSLNQLIDLTNFNITYNIGDKTYNFGVNQMANHVSLNDAKMWVLDSAGAAKEFVSTLKSELDTYGDDLTFTTTQGETITVPGGNWGWRLDTESTKQKLIEQISTGEDAVGELVWAQKAPLYGDKEFVNYVEIDMGDQHLYLYTNNNLVGDWPIVTGTYTNTGRRTPEGVYILNYKTTDTYLRGPTWNSWVMYWMPFNGGIGMHDANWRSSFGGNIYMYNGSHGCINMPTEGAKTVYNAIDKTYAIICYY